MFHRVRRKMNSHLCAILLLGFIIGGICKSIKLTDTTRENDFNDLDNDIIDFDDEYSVKYDRKYGMIPWHSSDFNKESFKYTLVTDDFIQKSNEKQDNIKVEVNNKINKKYIENQEVNIDKSTQFTPQATEKTTELSVIPLELLSTTDIIPEDIASTTELDLTVIPLSTEKAFTKIVINQTVTLPGSTELSEDFNLTTAYFETTTRSNTNSGTDRQRMNSKYETTTKSDINIETNTSSNVTVSSISVTVIPENLINTSSTTEKQVSENVTEVETLSTSTNHNLNTENIDKIIFDSETTSITNVNEEQTATSSNFDKKTSTDATLLVTTTNRSALNKSTIDIVDTTTSANKIEIRRNLNGKEELILANVNNGSEHTSSYKDALTVDGDDSESTDYVGDIPVYTELDTEDSSDVPEDYYDAKDVLPTSAPKTDALSVIFGFAGSVVESVVESVAERVVPKGLFDLFKRMQKQNEALEAEKLRSREENGGIGQFTRGVIKSLSSGISKPLSQLMAGVRDIGSLDSDRGFLNSLASGVTSVADVANSMADLFKDRVQAIYPGTVWCGDGHSPQARSGELGLFFFTDTCCRQHDACKMYIAAGETKFGLTNTGLFTRSHCSCDAKFRSCLQKTNSLVSAQIGLTYFNVLGPQCFRKAHPIVRCVRRTRITGLKCEEYELDYTKPKMWQWFDNETF